MILSHESIDTRLLLIQVRITGGNWDVNYWHYYKKWINHMKTNVFLVFHNNVNDLIKRGQ